MEIYEAAVLGLLQGLTEFLPVSSSGHIELGKFFMDVEGANDLSFTLIVHAATVLSTMVVFRKDIVDIFKGLFQFKWNDEARFAYMVVLSMIPAGVVGFLFKEQIEEKVTGNIILVGCCLLVTAGLLFFTSKVKKTDKPVTPLRAVIIGVAQMFAMLPGISRSGATISTALYLQIDKAKAARFSFLMVIPLILGASAMDLKDLIEGNNTSISTAALLTGFATAFFSGWLACSAMLRIVKSGKLSWFALYCVVVGIIAIIFRLTQ